MESQPKKSYQSLCEELPPFSRCQAYALLKKKAVSPPSLKESGFLTPERLRRAATHGAGVTVSWAFQKIDDECMGALMRLAEERQVFDQMDCLFRGEKVNTLFNHSSEERAVLHPAMRDLFSLEPKTPDSARAAAQREIEKLEYFLQEETGFTDLVLIGIGGSQLGPHALIEALKPYYLPQRHFHFVSNVDPDEMTLLFRKLDLRKTLVAVISKSGTTLETATNEARARSYFEELGVEAKDHFIAITQPKTPMDTLTTYREVFYMWETIGGRYSSTSMVGGVLIGFMTGAPVFLELLKGASLIDQTVFSKNIQENPALALALIGIWNRNFLGYPTLSIIPYSQGLHRFVAHLQQCDMESNGKSITKDGRTVDFATGPVIWGEPGTNAQHSFFQLIHQGTDVIPVDFIGFRRSQTEGDFVYQGTSSQEKLMANFLAQALALAEGKDEKNPNKRFSGDRPSTLLILEQLTPKALGALLALYENKIAFQGFIWGINSFDQEGVQLGKVLSTTLLEGMKKKKEHLPSGLSPLQNGLLDMVW